MKVVLNFHLLLLPVLYYLLHDVSFSSETLIVVPFQVVPMPKNDQMGAQSGHSHSHCPPYPPQAVCAQFRLLPPHRSLLSFIQIPSLPPFHLPSPHHTFRLRRAHQKPLTMEDFCTICNESQNTFLNQQQKFVSNNVQGCGHLFCHTCVARQLDRKKSFACPACGTTISKLTLSEQVGVRGGGAVRRSNVVYLF